VWCARESWKVVIAGGLCSVSGRAGRLSLRVVCVLCQGELEGSQLYKKLLEDAQFYYKSTVVSATLVHRIFDQDSVASVSL